MKYIHLLALSMILFSCIDEDLITLTEGNKQRLFSLGSEKRWLLQESDESEQINDSCEYLIIREAGNTRTYERLLLCMEDTSVIEEGVWSFNEGTERDTVLISRDTTYIATDTLFDFREVFINRVPQSTDSIADTAVVYRDTLPLIVKTQTFVDSLFANSVDTARSVALLEGEVTDTLFAIIDTLRLVRDMSDLPERFPVDSDTLFIGIETDLTFIYNPEDVPQTWIMDVLTIENMTFDVVGQGKVIRKSYLFSPE